MVKAYERGVVVIVVAGLGFALSFVLLLLYFILKGVGVV
jgi:hypothetical protein